MKVDGNWYGKLRREQQRASTACICFVANERFRHHTHPDGGRAGPGRSAEDATRQRDSLGIKVIFKNGATAADIPSMRVPTSKKIEHPRVEVEEFAPRLNKADEKFFSF